MDYVDMRKIYKKDVHIEDTTLMYMVFKSKTIPI